jgi:GDP-L-fucose synthase
LSRLPETDSTFSPAHKRVFVAGHRGMVGSVLVRRLESENCEVLTAPRRQLDLTRHDAVERWMEAERPDAVFIAGAKVGGIVANDTYPADFLYQNLIIEANLIHAAFRFGVRKLVFLGSACVYPKGAPQPITEDSLLSGPLEPTNEWCGIAKIAGIKLCQAYRRQHDCDFVSAIPANLYGPGGNFDPHTGHALPALIRKFHEAKLAGAKRVAIWGTGTPRRDFLHADDCADALVLIMKTYSEEEPINIGSGDDLPIIHLAMLVAHIVGFQGKIVSHAAKPDGMPGKRLSNEKLKALGWRPAIGLEEGIRATYEWYRTKREDHAYSSALPDTLSSAYPS